MPAWTRLSALVAGLFMAGNASAATCRDPAGFEKWLGDIEREAVQQGIPAPAVKTALDGVTFDQGVIKKDRGQGVFKQSFEQFAANRITAGRLRIGQNMLKKYASTLAQIEQRYGVPGPVLIAIWGLETDYGVVRGNLPVIRSVATLAFDCRRTEFFTGQLFDALRIVAHGDLTPGEMRGAWAGEMGQTQFMPTSYVRYAVDFDGDGRADLLHSPTDVLASTANFLKGHGWVRGAGWEMGEPNFEAIRGWNKSQVYARTIGLMATKLSAGSSADASR
ncbi:lytic murein transglycosylase [Microvirga pudoricolor]|uniref:lytic murein transglycosylase n=1 Tax=Microvirga pudoricolor TaxID=2778729 RepID=UPI00195044DC|nr:lytic murein transglycosylase [Microvirga pudoricolor]MBM6593071.1 lytic murein transglycosylase [Microvirga pudoricolor]